MALTGGAKRAGLCDGTGLSGADSPDTRFSGPEQRLALSALSTETPKPSDRLGKGTQMEGLSRWYAVHCQPHRENAAVVHLKNQDFRIFLPRRELTRRHARKIEKVRKAFFPGYLFIHLDLTRDRWRCVNSTFGVIRIVMQNDRPAPAPLGVVEALIAASDSEGILRRRTELALGQKVRVINGPLTELVGELEQLTDTDRVRVLLDIMGGRTRVVLPRDDIVPTDIGS